MSHDTKKLAEHVIRAFEARDIDSVSALLADDVRLEDVPLGAHVGKHAVVEKITDFFGKASAYRWDQPRVIAQDNTAIVERTSHIALGGKEIRLPMVVILEFDANGKLTLFKDYFDLKTLEQQLA
ncbi:nuclear transport factor 2 family protein [Burkholderia vietnamiensis]|uniref:nuclear transport factor 2 family protein n=1 Tax=Burkholderia vietnamiensis TaxID=60552 RepID=UPI00075ACD2D|nr:nuclear transport factor 2 family protein [Burkholderia vietnamiensis]KVF03164.1 limonene-1,2-epoxide hydrolase [Burkholderia vietnamiensis]MBR7912942.1 nuclear transport factor 2 family protein [Burkholderia vietnamiensis]MCA8450138.1 nuclear transport factor 2 family protein [Burkholderia vietnamiensis]CAG9205437.1 Limonene-1,2-epoxide hydrolase [Burkholderia vietnamiensis]HDR8950657.1 nuclear transport factor 2 family protein [Burkholderia vietnamiensis]